LTGYYSPKKLLSLFQQEHLKKKNNLRYCLAFDRPMLLEFPSFKILFFYKKTFYSYFDVI